MGAPAALSQKPQGELVRGATTADPVEALELEGKVVLAIPCPYMVDSIRRWGPRHVACGAQALLYRFPEPYGFRSYCEENHVCVLSPHSIPGLVPQRKGLTD